CGTDAARVTAAATRHTQVVWPIWAASVPLSQIEIHSIDSALFDSAAMASCASGNSTASSASEAQAHAPSDRGAPNGTDWARVRAAAVFDMRCGARGARRKAIATSRGVHGRDEKKRPFGGGRRQDRADR